MSIFTRKNQKTTKAQTAEAEVQVEASEKKPKAVRKTAVSKTKAVKSTAKSETTTAPVVKVLAGVSRTLLAPLVTEKSAHLADQGVYAFLVPIQANRVTVGQAFREMYKITPVKINIIRVHGKEHRFGQVTSRQSDWKKALISVPKGTRIDIFEKI